MERPLVGQQAQVLTETMSRILEKLQGIRASIDSVDYTINGNPGLINKSLECLAGSELDKRFGDSRIPGVLKG